ncbi:hypothetical protein ASD24_26610 [Paenibacillus sp. Root52]|uniref:helix-turn-helix domain-containing protein n=1 Tax=Paenibacillus sp. Root52 TaxID=1736552 RepID=UPI0006F72FA2|nr:helix-turn-helix domain-containing protein [Paenibacillus sp. Root52]KQY87052.1 hypothetical protein ASD24_26610 [Paenibacillus sp. Root52]
MQTTDLIQALRSDIESDLEKSILKKLEPTINQMLYANIFTVKETASYLKLSTDTVRKMMKSNELDYFEQRGQFYCRQTDLDRYVASKIVKRKEA